MHITHAYIHTHTYTQQYTYIHMHAYNIYFWGICKIVLCILRIQKLHANFDYGCAISSTTVAQSSESCSPLKSPLLLICWSIDDITQFCRSHYDTSGPEPINGFPSHKLQITHHKLSMAVVGVKSSGIVQCWDCANILHNLEIAGAEEPVRPVWFWQEHFFGILVLWHVSTAKAPSYTSLKLLPPGCDVPNQAFQPIYMSFPCREQDGHGNYKAVAVKHKGSTRAHPGNWKIKVKNFFSVLCTVLIGTTHLYVLPSAVAVPLQKTLCHPWIVQMYCAILSWHTVSGIWECSAQSQDCANS